MGATNRDDDNDNIGHSTISPHKTVYIKSRIKKKVMKNARKGKANQPPTQQREIKGKENEKKNSISVEKFTLELKQQTSSSSSSNSSTNDTVIIATPNSIRLHP
jgi:hypothetical protein